MSITNDDYMYELLKAKRDGERIFYIANKGPAVPIEDDHEWNLVDNEYQIRRRREYIIRIDDRDPDHPVIERTSNTWTRSDFGRDERGEHILMREVYQDEM